MSPSTTAHSSALRWMQDNPPGRWPSPTEVAFLLKASMQAHPEQVSGTPTNTYTYSSIPRRRRSSRPLYQLPLDYTNSPQSPEANASQYIENNRADALQYLERQKANVPNIGKRVSTKVREGADVIRDGIVEGQIGYVLGKFAVEHDLANIPRLPEEALLGVAEDQYHSRDSYIAICNKALDHARQELKKGEMPIILAPSRDGDDGVGNGPSRQTCPAVPIRPTSGDPHAYMHLLDDPPVLPQKFRSAPSALNAHKTKLAERWQRANRHKSGSDNMYKDSTPERRPTALRPGRESKGKRGVSWKLDPEPELEQKVNHDSTPDLVSSDTRPDRHPTSLRPRARAQYYKQQSASALARTDSGRPVHQLSNEIQRSWESADILAPRTPATPDLEMFRKLSRRSRDGWKQKKVRRDTTIVGSGELSAVNDAMARIKEMSQEPAKKQPAEDIPTMIMPAEAVARLKQMGKRPTEPVRTIHVGLNPQARTWDAQAQAQAHPDTRAIRRQPAIAPLNPQAKTWDNEPLPPLGVPIKRKPNPNTTTTLNPQAKTWDNMPLPPLNLQAKTWDSLDLPINRKPVPVPAPAPTSTQPSPLSAYHRQTPTSGPVKFGDTCVEDPAAAVRHARERERVMRRRPARLRQRE